MARFAGAPVRAVFAPHLIPTSRGILSTIYVSLDADWDDQAVLSLWRRTYGDAPFVHVLAARQLASLAHAVHTNRCALSIGSAGAAGEWIIITAIDNLLKGASGQAVQNMNVMFGLDETMGLEA